MTTSTYQCISTDADLANLCDVLARHQHIAIDTEFVRERTFFPRVGLLQIAITDAIFLIDPLACDVTPLISILENQFVCKVMHSMSEDLEVFAALGMSQPRNFFDTQIAASWLGAGLSLSLQNLVQTHNDVLLNKSQTRTDWLKRPLSNAQLAYAAEDVEYLLSIAEQQRGLLQEVGFQDYVMEDILLATSRDEEDHELSYLNYGRAASMDMKTLNRFQKLIAWRERVARRDDRPKPHLLKDNVISEVAIQCDTEERLRQFSFHPAFKRRYLAELTAVLFESPDKDLQPVKRLQDLPGGKKLLPALKKTLIEIARDRAIPEDVMPSKRILEQILKHLFVPWYPEPKQWSGWRKSFILEALERLDVSITPLSE